MAQTISLLREQLASLLTQLLEDATRDKVRLRAADLAIEIAQRDSDPYTADVVEALLSDIPPQTSAEVLKVLHSKVVEAHAARHAIAQSFNANGTSVPSTAASATSTQDTHPRSGYSGGF